MTDVLEGVRSRARHTADAVLRVRGVSRRYGSTQALAGVDLELGTGELLGLVGHNGAGKSTLMRVLAGREQPDSGSVTWHGGGAWDQRAATAAGVRMVYQELALCPDLTVVENIALSDSAIRGLTWRRNSERRAEDKLDEVFPGHGIDILRRAGDLTMAQRQMVEIARALCTPHLSVLILDEPTESLSLDATRMLYAHLRKLTESGVSMVLISHRMNEVLASADRVVVMKDGQVVQSVATADTTEAALLAAMGAEPRGDTTAERHDGDSDSARSSTPRDSVVAHVAPDGPVQFQVRAGEIVGLAGLAGHGQDRLLGRLWSSSRGVTVPRRRAYVPGDRQTSGIFPLWTVADNLTVSALKNVSRAGLVKPVPKRSLAAQWVERLRIKGGARAPITSLSGGNQQKVLVARAFATDAELVLLDDPFRGVDVATKNELYALMRQEAAQGRSIVWYSTENSEMAHCDRVFVFRSGRIVSELVGEQISEERIIADSFDEQLQDKEALR